jgi:hypothetical protein
VRHARLVTGFVVLRVMARYPLAVVVERSGGMVKDATARAVEKARRYARVMRCVRGCGGSTDGRRNGRACAWRGLDRDGCAGRGRERGGGCGRQVVSIAD